MRLKHLVAVIYLYTLLVSICETCACTLNILTSRLLFDSTERGWTLFTYNKKTFDYAIRNRYTYGRSKSDTITCFTPRFGLLGRSKLLRPESATRLHVWGRINNCNTWVEIKRRISDVGSRLPSHPSRGYRSVGTIE